MKTLVTKTLNQYLVRPALAYFFENGLSPFVQCIVNSGGFTSSIPMDERHLSYLDEGNPIAGHLKYITLDLSPSAIADYVETDENVSFKMRFSGVSVSISVDYNAIIRVYNVVKPNVVVDMYPLVELPTEQAPVIEEPAKRANFLKVVK